jgi:YegS/Rv2252/BmrU family lipid kinase
VDRQGGADWIATERVGHAVDVAAGAATAGYDTVVAFGGDGIVHEVVNGLMRTEPARRPALGVVPIGSGNDFAFGAGVPLAPADAVQRLFAGAASAIDVASVRDGTRTEHWNNTLGIGFDARVNIRSRTIRGLHGFAMYFVAVLLTLAREHHPTTLTLTFDDEPPIERAALMLTLGNGPREGGGFQTTPASRVNDGVLEFAMLGDVGRLTLLGLIPKLLRGTHGTSRDVTLGSFRRLRLVADRPLPIHLDGELWARPEADVRQLEVAVVPAAIQLVR